jgi:hypothetical protein
MSWGKGWEVGIRKALWAHEAAMAQAREILAQEHGTAHPTGTRTDLCWKCQAEAKSSNPELGGARPEEGSP